MNVSRQIKSIETRRITGVNIAQFKRLFGLYIYKPDFNIDINVSFYDFLQHLLWCFEASFPVVRMTKPAGGFGYMVKFSFSLKRGIEELKDLKHLCRVFNDDKLNLLYKMRRREVAELIEREKADHFINLLNNSNNRAKTIWQIVKDGGGHHPIKVVHNGQEVDDDGQLAELFGCHFSGIVDRKLADCFGGVPLSEHTIVCNSVADSLYVTPVTAEDVAVIIRSLPSKSSAGCDNLSTYFFKQCGEVLLDVIAQFFNSSVLCGQFPDSLKSALIIPVPKKGNLHDVANYRPISLLSILSKIFEKLMIKKLNCFIEKHNILGSFQHGFRRDHSTGTAVVDLIQYINDRVDKNDFVILISFDLSCAFDTLRPDFMSGKLSALGLRGNVNNWLISFMTNRKSIVRVNSAKSEPYCTDLGTPQGSVLGPLLFLLYINDLPDHVREGRLFAYADDISVVVSCADPDGVCQSVKRAIDQFSKWCSKNRLIINLNKTSFLKFRGALHRNSHLSLTLLNEPVVFSEHVGLLGAVLDCNLTWQSHVDKVAARLNSACFALNSLKYRLNREALISVYYGLVYPHLNYCIAVWGLSAHAQRLFVLQKRALRVIFRLGFRESCLETFRNFHILTMPCMYIYRVLILIHSERSNLPLRSNVHNHNTRYGSDICLRSHNHSYYKRSPFYSGITLYNMLPLYFKSVSITQFKLRLKRYLCARAFYSVSEYVGELGGGTVDGH